MDNLKESEKSLLAAASESNGDAGFDRDFAVRLQMDGEEKHKEIEGLLDNAEEEEEERQQSKFKQVRFVG